MISFKLEKIPSCEECLLFSTKIVQPHGNYKDPLFMLLIDFPRLSDEKTMQILSGPYSRTIWRLLRKQKITPDMIWISSVAKCFYGKIWPLDRGLLRVLNKCKKRLFQEIRWIHPKFIICLGEIAAQAATGCIHYHQVIRKPIKSVVFDDITVLSTVRIHKLMNSKTDDFLVLENDLEVFIKKIRKENEKLEKILKLKEEFIKIMPSRDEFESIYYGNFDTEVEDV